MSGKCIDRLLAWAKKIVAGALAGAAGIFLAGNTPFAGAAPHDGSKTVVNTDSGMRMARGMSRGNVAANDRALRWASTKDAPANHAQPSNVMHLWDVQSEDTGGTLLFSDSPEYVKRDGILYSDTVKGDARILYYHLNDTHMRKKVAVVLENEDSSYAIVHVTRGGMSEPGDNYLEVGKRTQMEYFDRKLRDIVYVRKGAKHLLQEAMDKTVLEPGELVYGVFDFSASAPVKVSVIMYPEHADPCEFIKTARILPKDEQRLRGTFQGMDRILSSEKMYDPARDGIVYFPIGDNIRDRYLIGIDATDGSQVKNYGNYGVLYRIEIPTTGKNPVQYYLSPLGGVYAGAMTVDMGLGKVDLLPTPHDRAYFGDATYESEAEAAARKQGTAILKHDAELADLGAYQNHCRVSFEYSPPGASNLPVNIIMMPAQ